MKGGLAIVAAGGSFAATVVAAIVVGVVLDRRLGRGDLVVYALFAGALVGGLAAFRLVSDAIRSP